MPSPTITVRMATSRLLLRAVRNPELTADSRLTSVNSFGHRTDQLSGELLAKVSLLDRNVLAISQSTGSRNKREMTIARPVSSPLQMRWPTVLVLAITGPQETELQDDDRDHDHEQHDQFG